jgi:hypothetical protein
MSPNNTVALAKLDLGASQAIALAGELGVGVALIDDDADRAGLVKFGGCHRSPAKKTVSGYPKLSGPKIGLRRSR